MHAWVDDLIVRNWGFVLLRGAAAVVFGLVALLMPGVTLAALILLFGAWVIVDGIFAIITAIANHGVRPHWGWMLAGGALSVSIGVLTLVYPGLTAIVLLYFIAAWAVVEGITQVVAAIRLRRLITGEWALAVAGIAAIVFGILLFLFPGAGALAVTLWLGAFALVFGVLLVVLAFRMRSWGRRATTIRNGSWSRV